MNSTFSLQDAYKEMSCFSVMQVDFKHRCHLTMNIKHCNYIMNFFNYFEIMYCSIIIQNKLQEIMVMCIFIIIVVYLALMISHLINKFILPVLKILSTKLRMSEYLAGVTLLTFGNSFSDLIVNMMPIRDHAPIYTIALSNAMAVILLSGGTICILRPFKINGYTAIRDLLFLLLAGEVIVYFVFSETKTSKWEAAILVVGYVIYLLIIFVDVNLLSMAVITLSNEIEELQKQPYSPYRKELISKKLKKLHEFEQEAKLVVYNYASISVGARLDSSNIESNWLLARKTAIRREIRQTDFDEDFTRNILYNSNNPKNMFLFDEFLRSLLPINIVDWKLSTCCQRFYLIILSPIAIFCNIFIPLVDYRQDKHGWSKLLNCTQIITNPILCYVLVEAMIKNTYSKRYPDMTIASAIWTLWLTVPLAIIVFCQSRTDRPPPYHILFMSLQAFSSMLFLTICATELEVLFCIIGLVFHMTEDFVASCIRSIGSAMGDVIINVHLAMEGYEEMAFAASLAAPLFGITICMGIPCFFNEEAQQMESVNWIYGEYGENSQIFFCLAIYTTLAWTLTLNFVARRSVGIFSYILFMLFLLYIALAEWDLVHEISKDQEFDPR